MAHRPTTATSSRLTTVNPGASATALVSTSIKPRRVLSGSPGARRSNTATRCCGRAGKLAAGSLAGALAGASTAGGLIGGLVCLLVALPVCLVWGLRADLAGDTVAIEVATVNSAIARNRRNEQANTHPRMTGSAPGAD